MENLNEYKIKKHLLNSKAKKTTLLTITILGSRIEIEIEISIYKIISIEISKPKNNFDRNSSYTKSGFFSNDY